MAKQVTGATPPAADAIGRRERKRLETRTQLIRSAIELFTERSFEAVTVVDIANRADVDPSTFFRHFASKDAVLFTDMEDSAERVGSALRARPADEPLLESLVNMIVQSPQGNGFDPELELLRGRLTESSPTLHAETLVHRDSLACALADAIAERLGLDPNDDARPYLVATLWVSSLDWYRKRAIRIGKPVASPSRALDEIVANIREATQLLVAPPGVKRTRRAAG